MTPTQEDRLEKKMDEVLGQLSQTRLEISGVLQWREDREDICREHGTEIRRLDQGLHDERLARAVAIGKIWGEIGRKMTIWTGLAALLGTVLPSVLFWLKLMPLVRAAQIAGGG